MAVAPDFADRIRALAARPYVSRFFGFELDAVEPGSVTMSVACRPELGHRPGWFQGTIVTALAELAATWSVITLTVAEVRSTTLDQSITFLEGARGERLVARGRVVRAGRTISTTAAEVYVWRDGEERCCASMVQTVYHRARSWDAQRSVTAGDPRGDRPRVALGGAGPGPKRGDRRGDPRRLDQGAHDLGSAWRAYCASIVYGLFTFLTDATRFEAEPIDTAYASRFAAAALAHDSFDIALAPERSDE